MLITRSNEGWNMMLGVVYRNEKEFGCLLYMRSSWHSNFPFHWNCFQTVVRIVRIVATMFIHTHWFYATAINFILYANRLMSAALFFATEKILVNHQHSHRNKNSVYVLDFLKAYHRIYWSIIFWKNFIKITKFFF